MVASVIPYAAQSQLARNVNIPILILPPHLTNPFNTVLISLPRRAAEHAFHHSRFTCRPLLETLFVDVVATGGTTPYNLFGGGIELHDADGAVAFYSFALATSIGSGRGTMR